MSETKPNEIKPKKRVARAPEDPAYSVIQDFDNKRANAHATLFVASMFGSFTLLSVMDRLVYFKVFSSSNFAIFGLLLGSYVLIGLFGAYSLLNFFFYATTSNIAEKKVIQEEERQTVENAKKGWKGLRSGLQTSKNGKRVF